MHQYCLMQVARLIMKVGVYLNHINFGDKIALDIFDEWTNGDEEDILHNLYLLNTRSIISLLFVYFLCYYRRISTVPECNAISHS